MHVRRYTETYAPKVPKSYIQMLLFNALEGQLMQIMRINFAVTGTEVKGERGGVAITTLAKIRSKPGQNIAGKYFTFATFLVA